MIKCGIIPDERLIIAIIRRMDMDADAKINLREFIEGIRPLENFTINKS